MKLLLINPCLSVEIQIKNKETRLKKNKKKQRLKFFQGSDTVL